MQASLFNDKGISPRNFENELLQNKISRCYKEPPCWSDRSVQNLPLLEKILSVSEETTYFIGVWTMSEHTWAGRNLVSTCRPRDPCKRDGPCTWAPPRDWRLLSRHLSVDLPSDPEHNTPRTPRSAEIFTHLGKSTEGTSATDHYSLWMAHFPS